MHELKEFSSAPSKTTSHRDLTENPSREPSLSPATRTLTKKRRSKGHYISSEQIKFVVNEIIEDDKQVIIEIHKWTKRQIIGLSVAITLFGLLCVAVGVAIVLLGYWIQFSSGMSKYGILSRNL